MDFTYGIGPIFRVKVIHGLVDNFYHVERVHISSGLSAFLATNDSSGFDFAFHFDINIPPMENPDILGFSILFSIPLN
jgi:hypothetical protein